MVTFTYFVGLSVVPSGSEADGGFNIETVLVGEDVIGIIDTAVGSPASSSPAVGDDVSVAGTRAGVGLSVPSSEVSEEAVVGLRVELVPTVNVPPGVGSVVVDPDVGSGVGLPVVAPAVGAPVVAPAVGLLVSAATEAAVGLLVSAASPASYRVTVKSRKGHLLEQSNKRI